MRPGPAELAAARDKVRRDLVGPDVRLLLVGINPSLWSAAVDAPFARPGNRFYPALARAGIADRLIDAAEGLTDVDRTHLLERGVGITNLVRRATARADELSADELRSGAADLLVRIRRLRPEVVAFLGITAYRTAFGEPRARVGRQDEPIAGAQRWVLPNPSGLNAHETVDSLATAYGAAARAAGIELYDPRERQEPASS